MKLPWLAEPLARLDQRLACDRAPQALLVHGPPGIGRRSLALHFAGRLLGLDVETPVPDDLDSLPRIPHPDYWPLTIPEDIDRKLIVVEQVRELIQSLGLTSLRGQRRVAVVFPAELLNPAAANALLKTLEEPPPALTLILVSSSTARLPATVVSRCEQIRLSPPEREVALAWLAGLHPDPEACGRALSFAGGAPLAARELLAGDTPALLATIARDLEQLCAGDIPPTAVARQWVKSAHDPDLYLRSLYLQTAKLLRSGLTGAVPTMAGEHQDIWIPPLKNPASPRNMVHCCAYLEQLGSARRLKDRALNVEAMFAELLFWWYGGAVNVRF